MKISVDTGKRTSVVTLTMTLSQLNTIRYALGEGVDHLASKASYMRIMAKRGKDETAKKLTKDATRTAKDSKRACEALEAVTTAWATGYIEERRMNHERKVKRCGSRSKRA